MDRRNFLKSSCTFCAGVVGLSWASSLLTSCATTTVVKAEMTQGTIKVAVTAFADKKTLIVRNSKLEYDLLLVKKSESDVTALQMKCSHQDNPLNVSNNALFCTAHGSTFDFDGKVTKEPALNPIKKYKTSIDNDNVIIYL